ncbi:hypothetical protein PARPLA_02307 [Rhodobacteraceae bacterium THAF1]|uniref:hypothetical protein n=1 Tax=Palleronia sp. THAF1 TaxID=2587842 RepID=UPI000F3B599B|nr:hypothetical protein [Palleronia sp. THAF1]QFU09341.1 hypothetical protein FIU81_11715 [Palleronia sp. THAF1]VDC26795.1 hypothetical protein PARPLA_02307 [Rhodobacteraceae bacterium THAF1]
MKHVVITSLSAMLLTAPVSAQEQDAPAENSEIEDGIDMLSEGARRLMDGLMGEVEPRMRDLADALEDWNFEGLSIDDLGAYHPPERLPNGDIIIRRKDPPEDPMDGEIEI